MPVGLLLYQVKLLCASLDKGAEKDVLMQFGGVIQLRLEIQASRKDEASRGSACHE